MSAKRDPSVVAPEESKDATNVDVNSAEGGAEGEEGNPEIRSEQQLEEAVKQKREAIDKQ